MGMVAEEHEVEAAWGLGAGRVQSRTTGGRQKDPLTPVKLALASACRECDDDTASPRGLLGAENETVRR